MALDCLGTSRKLPDEHISPILIETWRYFNEGFHAFRLEPTSQDVGSCLAGCAGIVVAEDGHAPQRARWSPVLQQRRVSCGPDRHAEQDGGCKRGLDALCYSELVFVGRQPNGSSGRHAAEQLARRTDIGLSTAIIEVGSVEGRLLAARSGGIRRLDN